jgi:hypothetical protein
MLDQVLISFVLMGGCLLLVCLFMAPDQRSLRIAAPAPAKRRRATLNTVIGASARLDAMALRHTALDAWENEGGAVRLGPARGKLTPINRGRY